MPNYDYQCSSCGKVEERFAHMDDTMLLCSCGQMMTRLFSPPKAFHFDIQPYWEENIGPEPVYVESRKHLNQLCRERGIVQQMQV
jgi:putative FmdB family regulatory protein